MTQTPTGDHKTAPGLHDEATTTTTTTKRRKAMYFTPITLQDHPPYLERVMLYRKEEGRDVFALGHLHSVEAGKVFTFQVGSEVFEDNFSHFCLMVAPGS
jgi:hypothetical protein